MNSFETVRCRIWRMTIRKYERRYPNSHPTTEGQYRVETIATHACIARPYIVKQRGYDGRDPVTCERGGCRPAIHPELVEHLGDVRSKHAAHTSERREPPSVPFTAGSTRAVQRYRTHQLCLRLAQILLGYSILMCPPSSVRVRVQLTSLPAPMLAMLPKRDSCPDTLLSSVSAFDAPPLLRRRSCNGENAPCESVPNTESFVRDSGSQTRN